MKKNKFLTAFLLAALSLSLILYFTDSKHLSTDEVETVPIDMQQEDEIKDSEVKKQTVVRESFAQINKQKQITEDLFIDLNSNEFIVKEFEIKVRNSPYYPDTPFEAFIKHIENAESGDIDSQYIIYSVLKNCELGSNTRIKSVDMEFNHQRSDRLSDLIQLYQNHCEELFEDTEANIKQIKSWKKKLIENGHPFIYAEYHVLLKEFDNMKQRTGRDYTDGAVIEKISINDIFTALSNGHSGKYNLMANYLRSYTTYSHLNTEVQAWYLAECIKFGMCITNNLLNEYRKHLSDKSFSTSQIDEIFSEAYRYLDLVENEQWDELSDIYN